LKKSRSRERKHKPAYWLWGHQEEL